jgi:hypothetical protein
MESESPSELYILIVILIVVRLQTRLLAEVMQPLANRRDLKISTIIVAHERRVDSELEKGLYECPST